MHASETSRTECIILRYVWTTFSPDQIDLNYRNPGVLLRVIEILLLYVRQGADILRLDAVTYLWNQLGTRCIHLEQTHEIIKLLRDILSVVTPHVALVTETNVTKFKHRVEIPLEEMNGYKAHWQDLLREKEFSPKKERLSIPLQPYDVLWLVPHT